MGVVHNMKRNDRLPSIAAALTYSDGTVIDLTAATALKFIMRNAATGAVKINATAVIEDADSGLVRYDWAGTDTDTAGAYLAEWETVIGGNKITVPNDGYLIVNIVEDIA